MLKAMIHKFLVQVPVWCLLILFGISQQCSCLPSSSKEIDKARAKDDRDMKVSELFKKLNMQGKGEAYTMSLQRTRDKIKQLVGTPPTINPSNQNKIIKICKKFLQEAYIPYLEFKKEFLTQAQAYEIEASEKLKRENKLQEAIANISYAEALLRKNDVQELCKFIMGG